MRLTPFLAGPAGFLCLFFASVSCAQQTTSTAALKKLSVEQLMNVEVTLVSRVPEKLSFAASAIQVITGEDIRRSGATNLAEALRLVTNLQVAQVTSNAWIISSRGFNTIFANKLLVMIDGRTVYTPLFGGVIWEQQNLLLEDIERIEVVSGPGASLWGANAVNGVINVVTKKASDSHGVYAVAGGGNRLKDLIGARYGGHKGKHFYYKVYAQHFDRDNSENKDMSRNADAWGITQASFRMDVEQQKDKLAILGGYYSGNRLTQPSKSGLNGQNLVTRWTHTISDKSDYSLQLYYDRYFRADAPGQSSDKLNTFDLDFQYRLPTYAGQNVLVGAGYRVVRDRASYPAGGGVFPLNKKLDLFTAFIQDEIILADSLRLIAGTKIINTAYSGTELQPGVRLAWTRKKNTVWTAVSKAVRTGSRLDVDYYLPMPPATPGQPNVAGGPNFVSEKMVAYEAGYRTQPDYRSTLSLSFFYNVYRDVYSVEADPGTVTYKIQNGALGESWGIEFAGTFQPFRVWRLRAGYTYFNKDLRAKPGHIFNPDYLGNDVRNQAMIQSMLDLPFHLRFDITGRHLDKLPATIATPAIPSYFCADARLSFTARHFELSVIGQNLPGTNHKEFGSILVARNYYIQLTTRF